MTYVLIALGADGDSIRSEKVDPLKLQSDLAQFSGTALCHRWNKLFYKIVLSDGAKYLAEQAGAYWLMDAIASYQHEAKFRGEDFQVWELIVHGSNAILVAGDGNGNKLVSQRIPYTDFPLHTVKLYLERSENLAVIMLPGEH